MKIFFTTCIISLFVFTINAFSQSGTFDFTTVSNPTGPAPSQLIDGVTLTVSDSKSGVRVDDGSGGWGTHGNVCYSCSAEPPVSMTLTFSQHVYIVSLQAGELNSTSKTWIFTPYNGATAGTSYSKPIDGSNGTSVTFPSADFGNIDKIVITVNGGSTANFILDDIVMNAPLPVELTSFTGTVNENKVVLNWATATEVNNYGFNVEAAYPQPLPKEGAVNSPLGGKEGGWKTIGFVQGNGNSNLPKEYSFTDANPPVGKLQYRLKQIDLDGAFEYSPIVEVVVTAPSSPKLEQNYPNPFNPETVISYQLSVGSHVTLKVFDVLGREVATLVDEYQQPGKFVKTFHGTMPAGRQGPLPSGIYFYTIRAGNFVQTQKMILMK